MNVIQKASQIIDNGDIEFLCAMRAALRIDPLALSHEVREDMADTAYAILEVLEELQSAVTIH